MAGLIPVLLVAGLLAGTVLVAFVTTLLEVPELQPVGVLAVVLLFSMAMLLRGRRSRREPPPPVLDSRRWTPGGRDLV